MLTAQTAALGMALVELMTCVLVTLDLMEIQLGLDMTVLREPAPKTMLGLEKFRELTMLTLR